MTALAFDAGSHTYRWNGEPVPGVTSILAPLTDFERVPAVVLQAAADFGRAVHLACELHDIGDLDEDALDPELRPYLAGWKRFSAEHAVQWIDIERPVYNAAMRYAGTPDRVGAVAGSLAVVDIKTTAALYPSVGPQLAAYAYAATRPYAERIAVQLKANGTYTLKRYTDPMDWTVFCSLLTLRNWCQRHSITPHLKG